MKKILFLLLAAASLNAFAAEPSAEKQAEIRRLLQNTCSSCHGAELKGAIGPALKPETLANKADDMLIDTIYNGRKGTMMSSWKASMNKDEIAWLVSILKSGK